MNWDRWIGNDPNGNDSTAVMWVKHLFHRWGRRIDLHKIVKPDDESTFHTHPATAVRVILHGGYVEEILQRVPQQCCIGGPLRELCCEEQQYIRTFKVWLPGDVGIIRPEFCHRIHALIGGSPSYSLWFRGRITHDIRLVGWRLTDGYPYDETLSHVKEN
jgi:hypothetical protein